MKNFECIFIVWCLDGGQRKRYLKSIMKDKKG